MPAKVTTSIGSITEQPDCDAIVNSANANLRGGSGVCGVIYRVAGPELEPYTMQFAPLGLGKAIVSPGFKLAPQSIIHVKGPHYLLDPNPEEYLAKAMQAVIDLAEESGFQRIAVPAISTGVFKFPMEQAASILVATARKSERLKEIRFVVVDMKGIDAFVQAGAASG
jgi:O-acetyl-ADP-ribose deacetylase (regulator of RNase III)